MTSLRKIASHIAPSQSLLSCKKIAYRHRWNGENIGVGYEVQNLNTTLPAVVSLREIFRRHPDDERNKFRFLTYNTYLLRAFEKRIVIKEPVTELINAVFEVFTSDKPIPNTLVDYPLKIGVKPTLHQRAPLIGDAVRNDYDIASLYEIFDNDVFNEVTRPWQGIPLQSNSGEEMSGLRVIVQKGGILRRAFHKFEKTGRVLDSDYYANKGVLFTSIDTGYGELEIFSTHLFFGGGFPVHDLGVLSDMLRAVDDSVGLDINPEESNPLQRTNVKLTQVMELIDFYNQHHRPGNVAIIVGDFNIDANANVNRNGSVDEYNREYRELSRMMESINMYDLWIWDVYNRKLNSGFTSRYTDDVLDKYFSTCVNLANDYCDDDTQQPPFRHEIGEGRLDYIFIQKPEGQHTYNIDVSIPRRRAFKKETEADGEVEHFLSDHLGLAFDIYVSPR